ncbi:MAG: hypothetical protein HKN18_02810 [Silicimonas sp.]|nr:hypothetical protein [Silicimonas sp.]
MDQALAAALSAVSDPAQLLFLAAGVVAGLVIGVVPGLSGIFGMAILVPLTYGLEPTAALALLLGMASVTTTSDTIPAVLVGVPGTVGAMATVEDGFPLAKKGQASRAFGAAYSASLIGGLFGALVLAASIPVMRPVILAMKTPDFLAISMVGLMFVALLAGSQPVKGIMAALLGLFVAQIGIDGQTASERFTFGQIYLWDGLPLAAVFLGIFGLPELAGLLRRKYIAPGTSTTASTTIGDGMRDTLREWRLVLQSSSIGALLGAVPGIGLAVIDWISYGFASRNRRGGPEYGTGNIRGVIAPESANNAKEGGSLIPTIAFGLPGSASMSILLGAFVVHGIVPGPRMLTSDLSLTYSMILWIALANVLGTVICLLLTGHLARLALLPVRTIVPIALVFVILGAFQSTRSLGDIAVLLVFGAVGMAMKSMNWPRAPFALGFVLGPLIERYFFLSQQLTGLGWLTRPSILFAILIFFAFIIRKLRAWKKARREPARIEKIDWRLDAGTYLATAFLGGFILIEATGLPRGASAFPTIVGTCLVLGSLFGLTASYRDKAVPDIVRMPTTEFTVLGLVLFFTALLVLVGPYIAVFALVAGVIATDRRSSVVRTVLTAGGTAVAVYCLFGLLMHLPWPTPILL